MLKALTLIAVCALSTCACADIVYKCKANGSISYGQEACAQGQALDFNDERSPLQKAQADANIRSLVNQVNTLEKQRQAAEALANRQLADAARARLASAQTVYEPVPRVVVRRVQVSRPVMVQRSVHR